MTFETFIVFVSIVDAAITILAAYFLITATQTFTEALFKKFFNNIILLAFLFAWFMLLIGFIKVTLGATIYDFPIILTGLIVAIVFLYIAKEIKKIRDTFGF